MPEPTNPNAEARAADEERIKKKFNEHLFFTTVFYEDAAKNIVPYPHVECGGHKTLDEAIRCAESGKNDILKGMREHYNSGSSVIKLLEEFAGEKIKRPPFPRVFISVTKHTVEVVEFTS